jgi:hypothetical protein
MKGSLYQIVEEIIIDLQQLISLEYLVTVKEYIADKCDSMRETLIRDELVSRKYIDDGFYQFITCSEVNCLSNICVINGIEIKSNTDIFLVSLSPLVTGLMRRELKSVMSQSMENTFMRVNFSNFINYKPQYSKPGPLYTIVGNNMYLKNLPTKSTKFISYLGIHQKPSTVCNYKDTDPYPVPSSYKLKLLVKQDILSTFPGVQTPKEKKEDRNENDEITAS